MQKVTSSNLVGPTIRDDKKPHGGAAFLFVVTVRVRVVQGGRGRDAASRPLKYVRARKRGACGVAVNLDSSVECLTQRRREAESAENARNLANTMNDASNLLEAKHHLKGETTNCLGHCDKTTNFQFSQHSLPLCASA